MMNAWRRNNNYLRLREMEEVFIDELLLGLILVPKLNNDYSSIRDDKELFCMKHHLDCQGVEKEQSVRYKKLT